MLLQMQNILVLSIGCKSLCDVTSRYPFFTVWLYVIKNIVEKKSLKITRWMYINPYPSYKMKKLIIQK